MTRPFGGRPVCDFCLGSNPSYSFTSAGGDYHHVGAEADALFAMRRIIQISSDAWAACARCATVIESKDAARLAKVVAECIARRFGSLLKLGTREQIDASIASRTTDYTKLLPLMGKRRAVRKSDCDEFAAGADVRIVDLNPTGQEPGLN